MRGSESRPSRQTGFGPPVVFDLTMVRRPRAEPTVFYLAPEVPVRPPPTTWRTVAGFGAVISAGLSLGLLLARLLLV